MGADRSAVAPAAVPRVGAFILVLCALIVLVAGCGGSDPVALQSVAPSRPNHSAPVTTLTVSALRSAPVPALCGHHAGSLVDGELPGIPDGQGFLQLRSDLVAFGDVTGDGVPEATAVFECSAGGVGLAHQVVMYVARPEGPGILGALNTWSVEPTRDAINALEYQDGKVSVESRATNPGDAACCPSGDTAYTLAWNGRNIVATKPTPSETSTSSASPPTPRAANYRQLSVGQTAHFPYFDVTVDQTRHAPNGVEGGGTYGVRISVCYTHRHPGANSDGSTRTSTDPWKFGWTHDIGVAWALLPSHSSRLVSRWDPAYAERRLSVGECNSGWIAVDVRDTVFLAQTGVRYAPSDFDFSGTWTLR